MCSEDVFQCGCVVGVSCRSGGGWSSGGCPAAAHPCGLSLYLLQEEDKELLQLRQHTTGSEK